MADVSGAGEKYQLAMLQTANPRTIEVAALSRVTADLKTASERAKADHPGYIAALSRNLTLWTIFAADAAHPRNGLPVELRAAVIRLAGFVRGRTFLLQRGGDADVEGLLEVNRNVVAGLQRSKVLRENE